MSASSPCSQLHSTTAVMANTCDRGSAVNGKAGTGGGSPGSPSQTQTIPPDSTAGWWRTRTLSRNAVLSAASDGVSSTRPETSIFQPW